MKYIKCLNIFPLFKKRRLDEDKTSDKSEGVSMDKYGNNIEIITMNDGKKRQVVRTNKTSNFVFMGDTYSYLFLCKSDVLKVYWENHRSERKLVKDIYGRLFHYCYEEETNFNDGPDREDILWVYVADERDSDNLAEKRSLSLLRNPCVCADESNWVAAHENIVK